MGNILQKNPEGFVPGWSFLINGQPVKVDHLIMENPRVGIVEYGHVGNYGLNYDAPLIRENGGGGSVIIPWTFVEGKICVGAIIQKRYNFQDENGQARSIPSAIGGFLTPGQSYLQTVNEEVAEEFVSPEEKVVELPGEGICSNRAFFYKGPGEGIRFFAVYFNPQEIEKSEDGNYRVKGFVVKATDFEKLEKAVFIPLSEAMLLEDGILVSATARLIAWLISEGKVKLSF